MNDIDRFKFSFRNALNGAKTAFGSQRNLRIHLVIGSVVTLISALLKIPATEFLIILLMILIVIITELFNTAVEFTIDLVSPEYNQIAKRVKDISAAAVLIAALFAVVIGILIFLPKIYGLLIGLYR